MFSTNLKPSKDRNGVVHVPERICWRWNSRGGTGGERMSFAYHSTYSMMIGTIFLCRAWEVRYRLSVFQLDGLEFAFLWSAFSSNLVVLPWRRLRRGDD